MKLTGHPATNLAEAPPPPSNVFLQIDMLTEAQDKTEQLIQQIELRLGSVMSAPNDQKEADYPSPGVACALSESIHDRARRQRFFNVVLGSFLERLAI
jgi:hypothetical protein